MHQIKWINWLSQRPVLNLLLLFIYFLLVVLPHEQVGVLTVKIFGNLERSIYNLVITILSMSMLIVTTLFFLKRIIHHSQKKLIAFYLLSTTLFAVLCFKILFVINIEFVHFIQYAVFSILCFPLTLSYTQTLIWTTLAGAFDEAYQYFYLAPDRTNYYDFNDVIINLVGAAFGLIIIKIINPVYKKFTWTYFLKTPLLYCIIILSVLIGMAFATNFLGLYPTDADATHLLVKKMPTQFWSIEYPEIIYHILLPFEGLLIMFGLFLFYGGLEKSTHPFVKTD